MENNTTVRGQLRAHISHFMRHIGESRQATVSTNLSLSGDNGDALVKELLAALRFTNVISYDALRTKWQSTLAGKPNYGAGLISMSSLKHLKAQLHEESLIDEERTMLDWVEDEYQNLLRGC